MSIEAYLSKEPRLDDYWRGIVLFGRNVASYKFALAKTLLDLQPQSGELVKLSDLAPGFALHVCDHLRNADKQATSQTSQFLSACRRFNERGRGEGEKQNLLDETVRRGFVNVIDAFHVVNQQAIPKRFFLDERKENGGIRITDEFSNLLETTRPHTLAGEAEARWRLVETAWELGIVRNLLHIDYDDEMKELFSMRAGRRKPVTSCRDALNGYQKGKCFYCFAEIMQSDVGDDTDVDHFFPHALKRVGFGNAIDGVWNLVLSCKDCNRGANGKFARIPVERLVARLSMRNEFLIASQHPLRETLMTQTGSSDIGRKEFLRGFHQRARNALLHTWEAEEKTAPAF